MCVTLLTGVWAQGRQSALADKVVRLHVIAASDSAEDQRVKLEVRDALLAYLTPRLEAASGAGCRRGDRRGVGELQRIAETASGGSARVELGRETYPTREYETFSLPAGVYTSLRITLGAGSGRNWWSVVYPPLCTSGVETAQEAAVLSDDDVKLITEDGEGYVLRFRLLEWWGSLTGK